ncbi:MAG: hypothetical protein ACREU2_19280 [Steroidobacteraceae bacterium]
MRNIHAVKNYWLAAVAGLTLVFGVTTHASMVVTPQISGQVTAVAGGTEITIGGVTYLVAAGSAASHAIQNVHVGDSVGLVLSGPPGSAASEVVAIVVASSHK